MKLIKRLIAILILVAIIFICIGACENIKNKNTVKNLNNKVVNKITDNNIIKEIKEETETENINNETNENTNNEEEYNYQENYEFNNYYLEDFNIYMAKTTINVGETVRVKIVTIPNNINVDNLKIATGNSYIASVGNDLSVTGIAEGTCNIYITVNDIKKRFVINVENN